MDIRYTDSLGSVSDITYINNGYPVDYGNKFSLITDKKDHINISNVYYENFVEMMRLKVLQWPVKVLQLNENSGILVDIPELWIIKT